MKRDDILTYRKGDETNRIVPLIITYHHKFSGISKVIQNCFKRATSNADFLKIFPKPPLVSFRKTTNLKDQLVRANHHKVRKETVAHASSRSLIDHQMNNTGQITNPVSGRTCKITGGPSNVVGCIYAAECTKHSLMYVGETGNALNTRFNGHRSDTKLRSDRCELDAHFASNDCDIDKDMRVSVLETLPGATETFRLYKEDKWITRLETNKPKGLNVSNHDFGHIYKSLFGPSQ